MVSLFLLSLKATHTSMMRIQEAVYDYMINLITIVLSFSDIYPIYSIPLDLPGNLRGSSWLILLLGFTSSASTNALVVPGIWWKS